MLKVEKEISTRTPSKGHQKELLSKQQVNHVCTKRRQQKEAAGLNVKLVQGRRCAKGSLNELMFKQPHPKPLFRQRLPFAPKLASLESSSSLRCPKHESAGPCHWKRVICPARLFPFTVSVLALYIWLVLLIVSGLRFTSVEIDGASFTLVLRAPKTNLGRVPGSCLEGIAAGMLLRRRGGSACLLRRLGKRKSGFFNRGVNNLAAGGSFSSR